MVVAAVVGTRGMVGAWAGGVMVGWEVAAAAEGWVAGGQAAAAQEVADYVVMGWVAVVAAG